MMEDVNAFYKIRPKSLKTIKALKTHRFQGFLSKILRGPKIDFQ